MSSFSLTVAPTLSAIVLALANLVYLCGAGDDAKYPGDAKDKGRIQSVLRSLSVKDAAVDDTADALGIRKWSGAFELRRDARGARLVLDFYVDGKCVETCTVRPLISNASSRGEFAIQVVDLDYLPLRGGKAGHRRLIAKLKFGGVTATTQHDIAKRKFDFEPSSQQINGPFNPIVETPRDVPLFFILYPKPGANKKLTIRGGLPSEVIRQIPDATLLIVRLSFEEDDFKDADSP